jgi:hypothetical protein
MQKKVFLVMVFVMTAIATAFAQTVADFNVELTDDGLGVRIKGYTGKVTAVRIPAEIEGMPVREIGNRAFYNKNDYDYWGYPSFTSVTFPEGLIKIGSEAFAGCGSLTTVVIPDSVTVIGYGAFAYCYYKDYNGKEYGLTSITLPKNLTTMEVRGESYRNTGAFQDCKLLASVKFTGTSLSEIPTHTFAGTALTTIVIPEGVTKIGGSSYGGNTQVFPESLTSIILPSTLIVIEQYAFAGTKLKTLIIPDSVTTIGGGGCVA